MLYFKELRVFEAKKYKRLSRHKHHSVLQALKRVFMVEFKNIHKYVGAIYDNLACSIKDVFVHSCKETA